MDVLLSQGAEALVYKCEITLPGYPHAIKAIRKERLKKHWRHPLLDISLRRARHKQEVNCAKKAGHNGVPVPKVLDQDPKNMIIWTEFIEGQKLKDALPCLEPEKSLYPC